MTMACARYRESIQELAEGTIGPIRRAELQQHLDACEACRALAGDLRTIVDAAASLDALAPPDRVWLQIAGRLRQAGRVAAPAPPVRRHWYAAGMAIAAALMIAVGASLFVLLRDTAPGRSDGTVAEGNGAGQDPVQSIAEEIRLAEEHYQNAIRRLEEVAELDAASGGSTMDPQTVATLQKSLGVIDQAIAESRAALRTEPQNAPARDSLFEALRRKVVLLQDTVVLMNEMRKGNPAGAAQIVEGVNKS
jgi:hypothetical protein